ncbi:MAG: Fur family transcriptional regulator [Pseudonocardia sp.]
MTESPAAVTERLRAAGGRRTQGRVEVLRALADAAPEHLTAHEVHERVCAAGWVTPRSTVNRTLLALAEAGVVHTLADARPIRYGPSDPQHHHLVCRTCGSITDLPAPELTLATGRCADAAFQLAAEGLTLHGVCRPCRRASGPG